MTKTTKYITSLQHPLVKHLAHLRLNSDYRYEHKSLIVEGVKMVGEVAESHHIKTLLVSDETLIPSNSEADEIVIADKSIIEKISGMRAPEGIIAEVSMPAFSDLKGARFIIALDNISDPGNLGAIIRTALAFGWEGAFLIGDGCDPFNDKALRSARGATFRLPMKKGTWSDFDVCAKGMQTTPLAADLVGEAISSTKGLSECILVLGNEAHGPSKEVLDRCKKVTLPMSGSMESLNVAVAGGILMYLLRH